MLTLLLTLALAGGQSQTAPRTPAAAPRPAPATQRPAPRPAPRPAAATPPAPKFFESPYTLEEMRNKQAVIETSVGTVVVQLLPEVAPNHVAFFIKTARDGGYAGTAFHRVIKYAIVQGGDPLTRDLSKPELFGTGGMNQLKAEPNAEKNTAGAVSAVLLPTGRDTAGTQFFICVTDQPSLDGQYDVFGRVVDGIEVVQNMSSVDADAEGHPRTRVDIKAVTIRDTPPEPFVNESPAQLGAHTVVIETTLGEIRMSLLADRAPETVRAFLRMIQAGVYDGIKIHRVAANFVIQMGALAFRDVPLTQRQQSLVHNLAPEFSNTPNEPGIVSMARGDDPGSAQTSFFICTGLCRMLDGTYTVFGKVSGGQPVINAITRVPVDGETPQTPILVTKMRVE